MDCRRAGIEQLAGHPAAAVDALRDALAIALQVSERDDTSQIAARLSLLLADQDDVAQAAEHAALASHQAPTESIRAQALARAARSRIALDEGAIQDAEALGREAIRAAPADMLELRALLHTRLAEVVAASGRDDEARTIKDEAINLYERKGNLIAAHHLRA